MPKPHSPETPDPANTDNLAPRPAPATESPTDSVGGRLVSLDQFRGYTVLGMLVVNFLGGYAAAPAILKHHNNYCSYADTIMPHFLYLVGFSFRLTYLRRSARFGAGAAVSHALSRNFALILLGLVLYHLDNSYKTWEALTSKPIRVLIFEAFQRDPFQTLVHIGIASLWCLPVVGRSFAARLGWLFLSAGLFQVASVAFYYEWVMTRPGIDGGPLGFLTWSVPLLVGTFAHDLTVAAKPRAAAIRLFVASWPIMILGYVLACVGPDGPRLASPPFFPPNHVPDLMTMSQRAGSLSYLVFAAGFSLLVHSAFIALCDVKGLALGVFGLFGRNALAAYVVHMLVSDFVQPYVPKDSPGPYLIAGVAVYLLICWLFQRHMERHKLILKL